MQRIRFDPLEGPLQLPPVLQGLVFSEATAGQQYYVVQFGRRFEDGFETQVRAAGAELLEYLPEATFLSRIPPAQVGRVRQVPVVRWVGPYQPAFRLSENLDPFLQSEQEVAIQLRVFASGDPQQVAATAARAGAAVLFLSEPNPDRGGYVRLKLQGRLIPTVAAIDGVAWLEKYAERR